MGVSVGVEHIAHRKLAGGDHKPVGALRSAQLVQVGIDSLDLSAQRQGLADEQPLQPNVGSGLADLIGLTAGKAGHAQGVAEPKALVDLRIDPDLRSPPRPHAGVERHVPRLLAHGAGVQAVGTAVGRRERGIGLLDQRGLGMDRPGLGGGRRFGGKRGRCG